MESPTDFLRSSSGQMMGHIKEVLEENRPLLTRNIILTEDFYYQLRQEKILSETMIADVQQKDNQDRRNNQLFDTFRLISTAKVTKFMGILQKTGHHFLHEFVNAQLEEKKADGDSDQVHLDVFKKIPALGRSLTATVKHQLANYIQEKIKEERVHLSWRIAPREKEKVMKAKVQLIEQAIAHKEELDVKVSEVRTVEDKLMSTLDILQDSEREVLELKQEYDENNDKHLSTIRTLNNFTHASEAEIDRLKERMGVFDSQVKRMNVRVRSFLHQDDLEYVESIKNDPDNVMLSFLERNIERLIQRKLASDRKISGLNDAQKGIRSLVMKSVGGQANDLMTALHIFKGENELEKHTLLGQVDVMEKIIAAGTKIETGQESAPSIPKAAEPTETFYKWSEIADLVHDKVIKLDNLMGRLANIVKRPPKENRAIAVVSPTIDYRNFVSVMEIDNQPKPVLPPIKSPVATPRAPNKAVRSRLSDPRQRLAPSGIVYPKSDPSRSRATSTGTRSPSPSKSPDTRKSSDHRLSMVEMAFPDMTAPVNGRVLKGVHVKKSNSMEITKKKYDLDFFEKTAAGSLPKH